MKARVLLVDDCKPWVRLVKAELQRRTDLLVVGEASDGLESVAQARELQPDLIILDIGLPKLNGIEAAQRIYELSPKPRILFLTENQSPEIAEQVLREGASGYLVKSYTARELGIAIDTVLQGEQFVCSALADRVLTCSTEQRSGAFGGIADVNGRHGVAFYANDEALVNGFARQVECELINGNPVLVIASEAHRSGIQQRLTFSSGDIDIEAAMAETRYSAWDNVEALSTMMAGDMPDPILCAEVFARVMTTVPKNGDPGRVAIIGECAPVLLAEGNVEGAIRLEQLWNQVTRNYAVDTLCGYLRSTTPHRNSDAIVARICAEHSEVCG